MEILIVLISLIIGFSFGFIYRSEKTFKSKMNKIKEEYAKLKQQIYYVEQQKERIKNTFNAAMNEIDRKEKNIKKIQFEAEKKLEITTNAKSAMQNMINGYGDKYLIPSTKLIDDLADGYGLEHCGSKLKQCRKRMREMIINGNAANSKNEIDYKIILYLFNVKAEDLISRVKHDNYGKLKQELSDTYALANYYADKSNIKALINDEYYNIRQDELRWASIIHTMRIAEREQQREIREQLREEEKARKEYERAIKETEKEEAAIQAAMIKARASIEAATAEQKERYERQLADLEVRLKEAEAKNLRALSMAQQTRAGNVYIISNIGSFGDNIVKIGLTRRLEPLDRVRELGDASVPFLFDVHAMIYSEDAPTLEKKLHSVFSHYRMNKVNPRKEFFRVTPAEVKKELKALGINANFTLAAEAAEYRETMRIESMNDCEQDKILNNLLKHETEIEVFS